MANKSNLLKEAIADAKAVRETAIANAKLALEEAFTPKLQSMLSRKIEEDMEDEDDTVEEQSDSSNIGAGDNKVNYADGNDEEKAETETSSAAPGTEGEDKVVDKLTEAEDEEESTAEMYKEDDEDSEEMTETEDDEMSDGLDAELEEIIKELEAEDETAAEDEDPEEMAMETEDEEEMSETEDEDEMSETEDEEMAAEDEEMDLEEIIKSLREEDDDEEMNEGEDEETKTETEKELEEAYATIKSLKGTINEVNLLNAKLLFSNKLFRSHNLTEGQKMRVIETFDRATNVREVKLVFSTLAESLSAGATRKTSITESIASKATKSTKPAKAVIVEANQFNNRMKKLAGLL
tara:strand:- start:234 stop:1286 length:1053 start_codon:yes stop_codon:yes gene_type:complete